MENINMTDGRKNILATGSIVSGVSLMSAPTIMDLPTDLNQLSEPIGLILAVLGAVLKLVAHFRK
jgi:hypothetical protein